MPENGFIDFLKNTLYMELVKESDRGSAIVGEAILDADLQSLFTARFPESDPKLFDEYHALSTFNSKVDVCLAIGLIDAAHARDLNLVRKIRLAFAHPKAAGLSFDSPKIADRVRRMDAHEVMKWMHYGPAFAERKVRERFNWLVTVMDFYLKRLEGAELQRHLKTEGSE